MHVFGPTVPRLALSFECRRRIPGTAGAFAYVVQMTNGLFIVDRFSVKESCTMSLYYEDGYLLERDVLKAHVIDVEAF